nr:MAG TPA: hypothetical protein [Caudoviricetes sp.]
MKFSKFSELVARLWSNPQTQRRDPEVTILINAPGRIGPSPSVEVEAIHAGFDWDAGQVIIFPTHPLTVLTPEQVSAIEESVRKGQSWHAYEAHKKNRAEIKELTAQRDELLAALETIILFTKPSKSNAVALHNAHEVIARVKGGAS